MHVLRPNIRQEDAKHDQDSSGDEAPQNYMIETATPGARTQASPRNMSKGKERETRRKPLSSTSRRQNPAILPTAQVSVPPRPSELDAEEARAEPLHEPPVRQMRGLDAQERALWNWVNVYNLDAFLQEAYYYYEGKGIYSIALSRGLNLLLVDVSPFDGLNLTRMILVVRSDSSSAFQHFFWAA